MEINLSKNSDGKWYSNQQDLSNISDLIEWFSVNDEPVTLNIEFEEPSIGEYDEYTLKDGIYYCEDPISGVKELDLKELNLPKKLFIIIA